MLRSFAVQPFLQAFAAYGFEATKAGLGSKKRKHSSRNAMALPVLLAVLQSAVRSLDFSRASPTVQEADTAAALEALKLLTGA